MESFLEFDWDMASKSKEKEDPKAAAKNKQGTRRDGETSKEISDVENPLQERKLHLQEECGILRKHLGTYLGRAEQLLQESKSLAKAAQGTREQSQVFQRCGAKRGGESQDGIVTLNEQHGWDLERSRRHRERLVSQLAGTEQELTGALRDTEEEAALLDKELQELHPYREESVRAAQRVKELERESLLTRIRCAEETRSAKSRFVQEKSNCEREFRQRMQRLTWRAEEVALRALIQHVQQVKAENSRLRRELLQLIQHSQVLRDAKPRLQDQQEQLLRENQCAQRAALGTPARGHRRRRDNLPRSPVQVCPRTPKHLTWRK
ncbi:coiled-coil domain-containing protein 166 [Willisornis vidua]|uniref:Coiled-coil domain-containing protein 166 n=1 Tax=Willisornis vidua TaxID=1566151 RepID=A0ABQ9DHR9_9PASS|nr:coiled-coil domain-containing protein 166 [Willisornis vidua]